MGRLDVGIANLRSTRGNILLCLTRDPRHFPDCSGDPVARHLSFAASAAAVPARFADLPQGNYAFSVIHDENGNGRLDRRFGIPTEGVGFSRNPRLRLGAPTFASASFPVRDAPTVETVRVQYFL